MKIYNLLTSSCYGENSRSQLLFIFDGILINAATILTNGVFLSGYIVYIKGSDFLVGMLNNSSSWASIAAIISFLIFERMNKRKKFLLILNIASRVMICSIIFLPLMSHNNTFVLTATSFLVIAGNILWGFYSIGITVMMINLLPNEFRNQYIYVRMFWLRISFTLTTIIMGFVLDYYNKGYTGFLIAFITSLVLSLADAAVLAYVDEPDYNMEDNEKVEFKLLFNPIKDKKYRNYLIFIFAFYLCLTISTSFTPLYLIKYLKFDYSFISGINVITYILMIVCTNFWSRIERRRGLAFVMRVTSVLVVTEVFIYSFLTNDTYYLLFLAPVISGIGYSGFNIAVLTFRYELIPEAKKTIYEGWFNAVYGLSVLASPVIGNLIMRNMPEMNNVVYQHSSFQFLYLLSSVSAAAVIYITFKKDINKGYVHAGADTKAAEASDI